MHNHDGAAANGSGSASDSDVDALLSGEPAEGSLQQVREILFGAESRRAEHERRLLESKVTQRFDRLEADCARRFDGLLRELQQRFDHAIGSLEAEAAERRSAMEAQKEAFAGRLKEASELLARTKTGREELAGLLDEIARRLRDAGG